MKDQSTAKWVFVTTLTLCVFLTTGCGSSETEPNKVELPPLTADEDPNKKGHLIDVLDDEQNEQLALAINLSGNLCAQVVGALKLGSQLLVECTEYRRKEPKSYVRYFVRGLQEGQNLSVEKGQELRAKGWYDVLGKKYVDAQTN